MNRQKAGRFFLHARVYFFAIACAAFHSVWILLLVNYFFDLSVFAARFVGALFFIVISFFCIKLFNQKINRL